jgi:hypothetical protein
LERWIRDLAALFRASPSYRRVVIIITALTVAPLLLGLVVGARVGGSVLGYAIWFIGTVVITGIVLGVVLWAIAMIWYRSEMP